LAALNSIIGPYVSEYLTFRRQLGFKAEQEVYQLHMFNRHLLEKGVCSLDEINTEFVSDLTAASLQTKRPNTVGGYLAMLEDFFDFLRRRSVVTENPFAGRGKLRQLYFSPYVFSDCEVDKILTSFAADTSNSAQWTYFAPRVGRHAILFLMAKCGLRISEACKIKLADVDFEQKTIFIEKTKFYKDRLIPVSDEVLAVINNYLAVRCHIAGRDHSESLFLSFYKRRYSRKTIGYFFYHKMKVLGIYREPRIKGNIIFGAPCPHSLRHSFAVRTVRRWYADGLPVDKIADTLATYMGHSYFDYTRLYLKDLSRDPGPLIIRLDLHGRF